MRGQGFGGDAEFFGALAEVTTDGAGEVNRQVVDFGTAGADGEQKFHQIAVDEVGLEGPAALVAFVAVGGYGADELAFVALVFVRAQVAGGVRVPVDADVFQDGGD